MRYNNIYKTSNRNDKAVKQVRSKPVKMKTKYIKCWKCGESVKAKPIFVKGLKKIAYYNKDGSDHGCKI
jgi:hypothetical protein